MKTYSFSEKYLDGSDDKTIHISLFVLSIIGIALNHLQTGVGKTSMAPAGKDFSWICKGLLWFMVFWEVLVSVLFLPHQVHGKYEQ